MISFKENIFDDFPGREKPSSDDEHLARPRVDGRDVNLEPCRLQQHHETQGGRHLLASIMINRENMRHVASSQTAAYIKIWLQPLKGWMMGKCWLMLKTCLHWNYFF